MVIKKQWKKNLYENTDYSDNYTDKTFLKELRKNIETKRYSLWTCLLGASIIVQEVCVVILYVIFYVFLYNSWIKPETVFFYMGILTILGFLFYRHSSHIKSTVHEDIRTLLLFLVFGHIFSPVLHTLTDTISTDTIYTVSCLMMCIHLIFFDYGLNVSIVSNSMSLSAAMFASICLASRLATPFHAFVLLTLAVQCFVLFPGLKNKLHPQLLLTFVLILSVVSLLSIISVTMIILFIFSIVFMNVVCPLLFVHWQKYKENIYGPWDEAIIPEDE